ncbi:MAG: hypothetical protein Q8P31_02825 [Bacillota bacterium]|nr:hypothetical protein [Bacillota bacterium]
MLWAGFLWSALLVLGRLPANAWHLYGNFHLLVFVALRPGLLPEVELKRVMYPIWIWAAMLVGMGVFEHIWFRRALRSLPLPALSEEPRNGA